MTWIVLVVLLIACVAVGATAARKQRGAASGVHRYRKHGQLFTPAERSFLGVLDLAVGRDFRIFGKVRVGDVLAPTGRNARAALNKINRKHFDFIVCRPDDLSLVCAIELNDKSHQRAERRQRDDFLAAACASARLPLIVFGAQHSYAVAEVAARLLSAAATPERAAPAPAAALSEPLPIIAEPGLPIPIADPTIAKQCPRCAAPMVKRIAQSGSRAGQEFWGCTNFPKCREIIT